MRHLILLFASLTVTVLASVRPLPSPVAPGSLAPALSTFPDGTPVLSWLEPVGNEVALKWSRLGRDGKTWSTPQTIARGSNWFVNWADTPSVTPLSADTLIAVWFVNNPASATAHGHHGPGYHAVRSLSYDAGATWSPPGPITGESSATEFAAILPFHRNARALAAWLDARNRGHDRDEQSLYAQTLLADGKDALVDPRVCDCCALSLVKVGDGALLAYRDRTADEVRDISIARWKNGAWEKPQPLHHDGWKIAGCPVNGPRLAASGSRVAAAWFTGAGEQGRVQVKLSNDGGETWGPAQRIDLGNPAGRVDVLALADGSALVSWLERGSAESDKGGIYVRRIAPDGKPADARMVAASSTRRAAGFPRMVEFAGAIVMAVTVEGKTTQVETLLLDPK